MGRFRLGCTVLKRSRRAALIHFCGMFLLARASSSQINQQDEQPNDHRLKFPGDAEEPRLPDGKSQKNAIAKAQHDEALKDAERLLAAAQDLRDELKKSGRYVVSVDSVKKTEEIERLAKRIRGRLRS